MPDVRIPTVDEIRNISRRSSSEDLVNAVNCIFEAAKNGDDRVFFADFISDKNKEKIRAMGFSVFESDNMTVIEWGNCNGVTAMGNEICHT